MRLLCFLLFLAWNGAFIAHASSVVTWTGAAGDGDWFNPANWNGRVTPKATDTVVIPSGNVVIPANAQFRNLNVTGGAIGGTTTINGTMNWSGGSIAAQLTVGESGNLNVLGSDEKSLSGGWITSSGRVTWTATNEVRVTGSTAVTNASGALFEIRGDILFSHDLGAKGRIVNLGMIRKFGDGASRITRFTLENRGVMDLLAGDLLLDETSLNNTGRVTLDSATLRMGGGGTIAGTWSSQTNSLICFEGGEFVISSATIYNGSGTYTVTGDVGIQGTISKRNFEVAGNVHGAILLTGSINWTQGKLATELTITQDGMLNILGQTVKTLTGGSITNRGGLFWRGGGIRLEAGPQLYNLAGAVFEIQADATMDTTDGTSATLTNDGILRKSIATGITTVNGVAIRNRGILEILNGTLKIGRFLENTGQVRVSSQALELQGGATIAGNWSISPTAGVTIRDGTYSFDANTVFSGPGLFSMEGTNVLNGTFTRREFQLSGTLRGSFTFNGIMTWLRGELNGSMTLQPEAILNVQGPDEKRFSDATLVNGGTVNWIGSAPVKINGRSQITNLTTGLFDLKGDISFEPTGSEVSSFINHGEVRKSEGTGTSRLLGLEFVNRGSFNPASGTIMISSSYSNFGTTQIRGASLILAGGGLIGGNWSFVTNSVLTLTGGAFHFEPTTLFVGTGTYGINGDVQLSGNLAILNFGLTGNVSGQFQLSGSVYGAFSVLDRMEWTEGRINGNVTIRSNAVLNLSSGLAKEIGGGVWNNSGTINWSGATRVRALAPVMITNLGSINITANGTLFGDPRVESRIINRGRIHKVGQSGTAEFAGLGLVNSGEVEISGGILSLDRAELQAEGTLRTAAYSPTSFARLGLLSQGSLGGTLEVRYVEPFDFWLPVPITPVTYGSRISEFGEVIGLQTPAGAGLNVTSGANAVSIGITAPFPTLAAEKNIYGVGETIRISFTQGPGNPKDMIVIFPRGETPGPGGPWSSYVDGGPGTNGVRSGTVAFTNGVNSAGNWTAYFLWNGSTHVLSQFSFQTVPSLTVTLNASPATAGVVTGSGSYATGATVTVEAFPNDGFKFVNWTENGAIQSTSPVYIFTVDRARTLLANFEDDPAQSDFTVGLTLNAQRQPLISFTASPTFTYRIEGSASLTAWEVLATLTNQTGITTFVDTTPLSQRRFYRVRRE